MVSIRRETAADHDAVDRVNERAFERTDEADLVRRLRSRTHPHVSLVAERDGVVVGHIFFSPVDVESAPSTLVVLGLAPMAVAPEHQNQGVGTALVRKGLDACQRLGTHAVVVLGHPGYYPRFGFEPASTFGLASEYDVPDEAFMALELEPGALDGVSGTVAYHECFQGVE